MTERGSLEHRHLRSAIQFAVDAAAEGQKLRPPLAYPGALKPFLKQPRVPAADLGRLRRAIEADADFRRRIASVAPPELVDPIGIEWLRAGDGWERRAADLVDAAAAEAVEADRAASLRRSEKRREAAEQVAARSRAELAALGARVEELTAQNDALRAQVARATGDVDAMRALVADAKVSVRHENDRAEAARTRLSSVEAERDAALARAGDAEAQRDRLLAERAERTGVAVSGTQVDELRRLAQTARSVADRLGRLVEVEPQARVALSLPGGLARDSRGATEHLLRASGVRVLIDGYNVAKLGWPADDLEAQRRRCLDVVDDVVRRTGADIVVVFDGADVTGAHAPKKRLSLVRYSEAGVSADDVIRAEVAATPASRPVVVVTNDQAIRRDVGAAGANLVHSDAFLDVARR